MFSITYPLAFPHLGPFWVRLDPDFLLYSLRQAAEFINRSLLRLRHELLVDVERGAGS